MSETFDIPMKIIEVPKYFVEKDSVSADLFISDVRDSVFTMYENGDLGLPAYFLITKDKSGNVLVDPILKVLELSEFRERALEIIQSVASQFNAMAVCFASLAIIDSENEQQESLVLLSEHQYGSPSRQFWQANITNGVLHDWKFVPEGIKSIELLPNLDDNNCN